MDPFDEFFRRMRRMFRDFDREFERVDISGFERMPGVSGFKIEIRDDGKGKPEVKVTRIGERERPARVVPVIEEIPPAPKRAPPRAEAKPREARAVTRMLETNVGKIEKLDEVVLTMQVSDVDKNDVEVRQLGNTLEVIARKRTGEAYFAAFELPPDAMPSEHTVEVKGGLLIISVPRRRRYPRAKA